MERLTIQECREAALQLGVEFYCYKTNRIIQFIGVIGDTEFWIPESLEEVEHCIRNSLEFSLLDSLYIDLMRLIIFPLDIRKQGREVIHNEL